MVVISFQLVEKTQEARGSGRVQLRTPTRYGSRTSQTCYPLDSLQSHCESRQPHTADRHLFEEQERGRCMKAEHFVSVRAKTIVARASSSDTYKERRVQLR